jgi:hypothetical protein
MTTPLEKLKEDTMGMAKALKVKENEIGDRIAKGKFLAAGTKDPEFLEKIREWERVLIKYQVLYEGCRLIMEQEGLFIWDKEDVGFLCVTKVGAATMRMVRMVEERGGVVVGVENFTLPEEPLV